MITAITRFWSKPHVLSAEDLREFIGSQAAYISQKCTVEYCRARSGLLWEKLFRERAFIQALDLCRWEAYAAVLVDVAVLAEAKLRPSLGTMAPSDLAVVLQDMVRANLERFPLPAHRAVAGTGWDDIVALAAERLGQAQLAAPKPAHQIGYGSAKRVFEVLPIHERLRGHDYEMVQNSIRFSISGVAVEFEKRVDPDAILADIAARP